MASAEGASKLSEDVLGALKRRRRLRRSNPMSPSRHVFNAARVSVVVPMSPLQVCRRSTMNPHPTRCFPTSYRRGLLARRRGCSAQPVARIAQRHIPSLGRRAPSPPPQQTATRDRLGRAPSGPVPYRFGRSSRLFGWWSHGRCADTFLWRPEQREPRSASPATGRSTCAPGLDVTDRIGRRPRRPILARVPDSGDVPRVSLRLCVMRRSAMICPS